MAIINKKDFQDIDPNQIDEYIDLMKSTDEVINDSKAKAQEFMNLVEKDVIVITGGFPNNQVSRTTNLMKIEQI